MATQSIAQASAARAPATTNGGGGAVAQRTPAEAILFANWPKLRNLLPSHIRAEAWYAAVHAALYRGVDPTKDLDLARAADRNPESLMFALFDAARQGLEPGTPQYYLTPRPNRAAKGKCEVLGIRGYQGEIELIYRAGAVASVVVEVVRRGGAHPDFYQYRRGIDTVPQHLYDPWMSKAERGELVGVYAYGVMLNGAVSRVVELNKDDIARAKRASPSAGKSKAFWDDPDDVEAMWLKTGVHRLQKFVPTSAERLVGDYTARAVAEATGQAEADRRSALSTTGVVGSGGGDRAIAPQAPIQVRGPVIDGSASNPDEPPDAPLNFAQFAQPPAPEDDVDGMARAVAEEEAGLSAETYDPPPTPAGGQAKDGQVRQILRLIGAHVTDDAHRDAVLSAILGRPVALSAVQVTDATYVHDRLTAWVKAGELVSRIRAIGAAAPAGADAGAGAGAVIDAPADAPAVDASSLPDVGTKAWHEARHPEISAGRVIHADVQLNGDCGICEAAADGGSDG